MKKKNLGTPVTPKHRKLKKGKTVDAEELAKRIQNAFTNKELFELVKVVQAEAPELFTALKGKNLYC